MQVNQAEFDLNTAYLNQLDDHEIENDNLLVQIVDEAERLN